MVVLCDLHCVSKIVLKIYTRIFVNHDNALSVRKAQ